MDYGGNKLENGYKIQYDTSMSSLLENVGAIHELFILKICHILTHKAHTKYISSSINGMMETSTLNNGNKVNGIKVPSKMNMYISQT